MKRCLFVFLCFLIESSAFALPVPIDLRTWTQAGSLKNGDWNVRSDGTAVVQAINGDPTLFLAPESYTETRITGQVSVRTRDDDDWFGFVLGFQSDENAQNDFYLLDWKQHSQDGAPSGMVFAHKSGGINNIPWSGHHRSQPAKDYEVLWSKTGIGWADYKTYEFTIDYTPKAVHVEVNQLVNQERHAILSFCVGGEFGAGQFGFYNRSQRSVRYQQFTEEAICSGSTPIPMAVNLFADEVQINDEYARRDPSMLVLACGKVEEVKQVSRPPEDVLSGTMADLRFEYSADTEYPVAAILDSVAAGTQLSVMTNTSLSTLNSAIIRDIPYQQAVPGKTLELRPENVLVFKPAIGVPWALQLASTPQGIQPITVEVLHFRACQSIDMFEPLPTTPATPEPATLVLFGLGLLGIIGLIQRTKSR